MSLQPREPEAPIRSAAGNGGNDYAYRVPEAFTVAFPRLAEDDVRELLARSWGITDCRLSTFGSERDDTLRVSSTTGDYVVKVAHPLDDPGRLGRQLSLMTYVGGRGLPFNTQTPIPAASGDMVASVGGRLAHLLPFLKGTPIRANPINGEGLLAVGAAVWQLQERLAGFPDHYDTDHPWALTCLPSVLSRSEAVTPTDIRYGCETILSPAIENTLPRLRGRPHYPTHNDVHTDNVLVSGQRVVGIVDWGDSVSQPWIADLAVAASYARGYHPMWLEGDPWQAARLIRRGYLEAGGPDEPADLLGELVLARLAQRIVLNGAIAETASDGGDYARRNMVNSVRDLNDLFVTRPDDVFPSLARDPLW